MLTVLQVVGQVLGILAALVAIAWYLWKWGWTQTVRNLLPVAAVFTLAAVSVAAVWFVCGEVAKCGLNEILLTATCLEVQVIVGVVTLAWLLRKLPGTKATLPAAVGETHQQGVGKTTSFQVFRSSNGHES